MAVALEVARANCLPAVRPPFIHPHIKSIRAACTSISSIQILALVPGNMYRKVNGRFQMGVFGKKSFSPFSFYYAAARVVFWLSDDATRRRSLDHSLLRRLAAGGADPAAAGAV